MQAQFAAVFLLRQELRQNSPQYTPPAIKRLQKTSSARRKMWGEDGNDARLYLIELTLEKYPDSVK